MTALGLLLVLLVVGAAYRSGHARGRRGGLEDGEREGRVAAYEQVANEAANLALGCELRHEKGEAYVLHEVSNRFGELAEHWRDR